MPSPRSTLNRAAREKEWCECACARECVVVVGEGVGGITHWQLASKGELAGDCVCARLCWLRDDLSLDKA